MIIIKKWGDTMKKILTTILKTMGEKLKNQGTINLIAAIGLPVIILLLGIMADTLLKNNDALLEMDRRNLEQHYQIMKQVDDINKDIHTFYDYEYTPTDSLAKVNSHRLDLQSDFGYKAVRKSDSVLTNHENRIQRIEKKVFK